MNIQIKSNYFIYLFHDSICILSYEHLKLLLIIRTYIHYQILNNVFTINNDVCSIVIIIVNI
jgi:hypothetical protein